MRKKILLFLRGDFTPIFSKNFLNLRPQFLKAATVQPYGQAAFFRDCARFWFLNPKILNLPLFYLFGSFKIFGFRRFGWLFPFFKKISFLDILGPPYCGIGVTIRIGQEMLCLPYAGFFVRVKEKKKNIYFKLSNLRNTVFDQKSPFHSVSESLGVAQMLQTKEKKTTILVYYIGFKLGG